MKITKGKVALAIASLFILVPASYFGYWGLYEKAGRMCTADPPGSDLRSRSVTVEPDLANFGWKCISVYGDGTTKTTHLWFIP